VEPLSRTTINLMKAKSPIQCHSCNASEMRFKVRRRTAGAAALRMRMRMRMRLRPWLAHAAWSAAGLQACRARRSSSQLRVLRRRTHLAFVCGRRAQGLRSAGPSFGCCDNASTIMPQLPFLIDLQVMLYDDQEGDCITPEEVWERLEQDLEQADLLLWVSGPN
jgi:hypothetical protein